MKRRWKTFTYTPCEYGLQSEKIREIIMSTIFEKIISGEIQADILYQDEICIVIEILSLRHRSTSLLSPRKLSLGLATHYRKTSLPWVTSCSLQGKSRSKRTFHLATES